MKQESGLSGHLWVKLSILIAIALAISVLSWFPDSVEKVYSVGIYPGLSATLRIFTKWIPFSIGDILYGWLTVFLVMGVVKGIIRLYRKEYSKEMFLYFLFRAAKTVLWIYIVFKLLWGLNYSRLGIAYQLQISKKE